MSQLVTFALGANPQDPPGLLSLFAVISNIAIRPPFYLPLGKTVPVYVMPSSVVNGDALTATLTAVAPAGSIDLVPTPTGFAVVANAVGTATLTVRNTRNGATTTAPVIVQHMPVQVPVVRRGRPLTTPEQSTGTVEIALTYIGGDFVMKPPGSDNPGDLVPLIDTVAAAPATTQRLRTKLRMTPRRQTRSGAWTMPSDPHHPFDGVGLDELVDELQGDPLTDEISARVLEEWSKDPGVAPSPAPSVTVTYPDGSRTDIEIEYDAITGATEAIGETISSRR